MNEFRVRNSERGDVELLFLFLLAAIVIIAIVTLALFPAGPVDERPRRPALHTRRICGADGSCSTVGIPAGECATVHGVTVCVGPDAGISP